MKIAVFGAGGIGGYFGVRLAEGGADVHVLARGKHLEAVRSDGLRISSANGDAHAVLPASDDPASIGKSDLVLFCVKSTDTARAARTLPPLLNEDTAVVTLQNGVDNEETIAEIVGGSHVVGGVAYILSTISKPGVIQHEGTLARIVVGEMDGRRSKRVSAFLDACTRGGIEAAISDDIRSELWRKFAMICAAAGMTAAVRRPLGDVRASPGAFEMYRKLVAEVAALARARDVALPEDLVEKIMSTTRKLPGEWYSSLHYDLTHGKPMELDALHGTVVRLARESGVDVPANEAIYGVLEPWAIRNRSSK